MQRDSGKMRKKQAWLKDLLVSVEPPPTLTPRLLDAVLHPESVRNHPVMPWVLGKARPYLDDIETITPLTYTHFADVARKTDRLIYKLPQLEKRTKMSVAALQVLLGDDVYVNLLHDYMWSTCEETVWILPHRQDEAIDLRASNTGLTMAELILGLGHKLEARVKRRVRAEIERRIFEPYLARREDWYAESSNRNAICNGAIGATFLLLEEDPDRLAHALTLVLSSLDAYVQTAFAPDGASGEGISYWHAGLINFIVFAELLRLRTGGTLDLLGTERMKAIAAFPPKVMLSPGRFFSYSDGDEVSTFNPGIIQRLAERTDVTDLLQVLSLSENLRPDLAYFHRLWRTLLWWNGDRPDDAPIGDALLSDSQIARVTGATPSGTPVVLAAKAQHNGVNHNHNDVGGFVLHVDGETFLCDPERGVYDQYKIHGRYNVPFAGSYGHSVPRIDGVEQSAGRAFEGEILAFGVGGEAKRVEMRIEDAYASPDLTSAHRALTVTPAGDVVVEDAFCFAAEGRPVEEAFVTWCRTWVSGHTALLIGRRHVLELTIEEPVDTNFDLEVMVEASAANNKETPLKRLTLTIGPAESEVRARVRARVLPDAAVS